MKYQHMQSTGLEVSNLCLGTMMFGGQTDEAESLRILRYAIDSGINFIDTANAYTGGRSETITGKGIKKDRSRVILATKVFHQQGPDRNDGGLNRRHIVSEVEASLRRLDTDYIDIYYLHAPDPHTPILETMGVMDDLIRAGKIRYYGISNYAAWQVSDIFWTADKHNLATPVITQNAYNLITRSVEPELVPCLQTRNLGMAVYNPIAGGLLTGKHHAGKPTTGTRFALNDNYANRYWDDRNFEAVDALTKIAESQGMSLLEFSMRWVVSRPGVDSVITGVSRLEQLEQNIASIEGPGPDDEALKACDAVWTNLSGNRFKYHR